MGTLRCALHVPKNEVPHMSVPPRSCPVVLATHVGCPPPTSPGNCLGAACQTLRLQYDSEESNDETGEQFRKTNSHANAVGFTIFFAFLSTLASLVVQSFSITRGKANSGGDAAPAAEPPEMV